MIFTAPYLFIDAGNFALHFHPDHLVDLRASGLSDATIRAAGVYSLSPSLILQFFSSRSENGREKLSKVRSALCFPYQGNEFARVRLFPAIGGQKYAQPAKTSTRLYMPFAPKPGDIVVCEGEKKTLAAYQAGLNVAGIGGVWSWLSNGEPIDDLQLVDWDDREVTIIPDSDVFQRADLLRAIYALGRELKQLGANVYIAQIPQISAAKVGLDDFLVAGGKISELEVFSLSHRIFKGCAFWHSRWKFQKTLRAAA
jgi:Domain of unknown function (DUF3854)